MDSKDNYGEYDYEKKVIRLKKANKDYSQYLLEEKFFHEILHAALEETEYAKLSEDEKLVERLSRALHQIFKTAKY